MPTPSVPITPLGPITAATVPFRAHGRLQLTAIVKATFALAPEARMTIAVPDPILATEVPDPSGRGLRSAGDLAPYLGETDVLLTGHAEVLPTFLAPEIRVWLAVIRDGVARVDRWLELDASARVGPARGHVHIDGAGPLSREWPRRSQFLEGLDARRLHAPLVDIPEGLDWTYFQAAPVEQRMELLRGDEWLVLGGIYAQRPRLRTQLPEARGVARLYRRGESLPREGASIALVADMLVIDVDRRCASILWRGHTSVEEAELGSLHVVAGVELPGRPIPWADPFPAEQPAPSAEAESLFEGTMFVPVELAQKLAAAPATPFVKQKEVTQEDEDYLTGTLPISSILAQKLAAAPATPFVKQEEEEAEELLELEEVPESTLSIPATRAQTLAVAPVMPFKSHWDTPAPRRESIPLREAEEQIVTLPPPPAPALEGMNPLEGTFQVPDEAARKLAGVPATPFERVNRGGAVPVEPPLREVAEAREDSVSEGWSEDAQTPVAAPVAPRVEVARPALLIAPKEEVREEPMGLGAEFLAAMEEAGVPA
jgi:hypothetical protein